MLGAGTIYSIPSELLGSGRHHDLPFSLVAPRALCYDLSYCAAAFGFVAWARAAGAGKALDGLGMLVEQAAESFAIWHGTRPDTDPVDAELRSELPLLATD